MSASDPVTQFVHDSLRAGHDRMTIAAALSNAGWPRSEVDLALAAWADSPLGLPVPRPRAYLSAREGFLYAMIFISLLVVIWHMAALSFALIDRILPDPFFGAPDYGRDSMRWSIAALIVFTPLFIWLNARAERSIDSARPSSVRRWFASVTLFLAAMALLGDAIVVIYTLLGGDLTLRFILKAGVVAVLAGLVLAYFRPVMDAARIGQQDG